MQKVELKIAGNQPIIEKIGQCSKCGGDKLKLIYPDRIGYICDCEAIEELNKAIKELNNNIEYIKEKNKSNCGFSKKDIEEVSKNIEVHKGNY